MCLYIQTHSQDKRLSELIRLTNSGGIKVGEGGEENNTASLPQPPDTWLSAGGKSLDLFDVLCGCCFPGSAVPSGSGLPLLRHSRKRGTIRSPLLQRNILPPLLSVPAIVAVQEAASGGIIRNVLGTSWTVESMFLVHWDRQEVYGEAL